MVCGENRATDEELVYFGTKTLGLEIAAGAVSYTHLTLPTSDLV